MSHIRLATLLVSLLVPVSGRAADGAVYLYLQPLPPDASRLTFAIGSVAAVGADGTERPLTLHLRTVGPAEGGRQRLLASGRVPAGSYTGFSLTFTRASLKGQAGDAALSVGSAPVRVDVPFGAGQNAVLLWAALRYGESIGAGVSFTPALTGTVPSRPIPDLAGFVTNTASNTITVFDKHLAQAVGAIDTCAGPAGMALDQRRRRLYVACSKDDEVLAIDVATAQIIERARISPGDRPRELALTADGLTLISANPGSNTITFFDALSLSRGERVSVGTAPGSLVIEPAGRRVFVFNALASSVSVVDLAGKAVATTIALDAAPLRGKFNRRGDRLYVIHERSPYMSVVDTRTLAVAARVRLQSGVTAIEVDTVRDLVCLTGPNETAVDFYDPNALMPLYSMKTKSGVSYLLAVADDNVLYLLNAESRSLAVAHMADRRITAEIDVGDGPSFVAVMGGK